MYILNASGEALVDLAKCARITADDKADCVTLCAAVDRTDRAVTLGRFATMDGAKRALADIAEAIADGEAVFFIEGCFSDREAPRVQDARVRRRGGS
jgi:hypothetical protein